MREGFNNRFKNKLNRDTFNTVVIEWGDALFDAGGDFLLSMGGVPQGARSSLLLQ